MSATVTEIRPKAQGTFVCPCGSQWFTRAHRFDTEGRCVESEPFLQCRDCNRMHALRKP